MLSESYESFPSIISKPSKLFEEVQNGRVANEDVHVGGHPQVA